MVTKAIVLRGGRLTKVGGKRVSVGPQLGEMISGMTANIKPVALAVSLALGSALFSGGAMAGSCTETGGGVRASGPAQAWQAPMRHKP